MSRYIDADKLHFSRIRIMHEDGTIGGYNAVVMSAEINDASTVDVEKVRYGKWIKDKRERRGDGEIYDYCCSLCKSPAVEGCYGNRDVITPYCSQCGAKMDKEKEE